MNVMLLIVTGLLALAFLAAGTMKLATPREKLLQSMPWVADVTATQVRAIGLVELLGAVGLVLPALTGIATVLVPVAATGLAVTMAVAAVVHVRRHDPRSALTAPVVLGVLALVVAVGRFGPSAF